MNQKTRSQFALIMATTSLLLAVVQALRLVSDNTAIIRLIALGQTATLLIVLLLFITLIEVLRRL